MHSWLVPGEQVLLRCRPHSRTLVWPLAVGVLLLGTSAAALAKLQPAQYSSWAPGAPQLREAAIVLLFTAVILIELAYPVRRVLQWANTFYVLTSQRVVVRRGSLARFHQESYLAHVQGIGMRQRLRQRVVGSGDLSLQMVSGAMVIVRDVPHIGQFHADAHEAWAKMFTAPFQQAFGNAYYANEVDVVEHEQSRILSGRERRKLGRK